MGWMMDDGLMADAAIELWDSLDTNSIQRPPPPARRRAPATMAVICVMVAARYYVVLIKVQLAFVSCAEDRRSLLVDRRYRRWIS